MGIKLDRNGWLINVSKLPSIGKILGSTYEWSQLGHQEVYRLPWNPPGRSRTKKGSSHLSTVIPN